MRHLLIKGNTKMGPEVYLFNLPPLLTCHPTPWCRVNCYALKGNFRFPSVKQSAEERYRISQLPNFVEMMVQEIQQRQVRLVRLHSSGDFYDPAYVQKWIDIAKRCPNTRFRTTTKRRDLIERIRQLNKLPNFIVRESLDCTSSQPTMGLPLAMVDHIPGVKEQAAKGKIFRCINDCQTCGYTCWRKRQDACFAPH